MLMLIATQIITLSLSTTLRRYEWWRFIPELGKRATAYTIGYKVQYLGKLYKVVQAHTSQETWTPISQQVCTRALTKYTTARSMTRFHMRATWLSKAAKYYIEDGVTYLCNRDTGNPVYNKLSELVGIYVEVVGNMKEVLMIILNGSSLLCAAVC